MQSARADDQGECFFDEVPTPDVDLEPTYGDYHGISVKSELIPIRRNEISKVELKPRADWIIVTVHETSLA